MKPASGQLALFDLDVCGWASDPPIEAGAPANDVERLEMRRARLKQCGAQRADSQPVEHAPERRRHRARTEGCSLLSPEEVARRCGLSRKAVYRAVARGELRAARIRSRLRIDPVDVEAWFRANLVEPASPPPAPATARLPASAGLRRLLPGT